CGNALRLDWLGICPPTGTGVTVQADDLLGTPLDQAEIDFENEGGETYVCGNPPDLGSKWQTPGQKYDLAGLFADRLSGWKSLDAQRPFRDSRRQRALGWRAPATVSD